MTILKLRFMIIVLKFIQTIAIQSDNFSNKFTADANVLRLELKTKLEEYDG